ncbi:TonB-dependent receptor [Vitreimonas sp.]|uniref:TonB-dependent receptor n=1 Tax=Vitreimonas sp. TaxID=3069702 RepID=UPI002EDB2DC1
MLNRFGFGASAIVLAALCTATVAYAQETDDGSEDIVVTARLRAETLQDAPMSVAVTTAEAVERAQVTTLLDLPRVSPGLNISRAPANLDTTVTIRGLGSAGGSASFESSVGFFVNGVYLPRAREFSSGLFDVDRIEVVHGTQSSLLGKNTSLGAVNLVTRAPGRELEGNLSVNREFELESWIVNGGVSIPLSDTLSVRLAGIYDEQGGWVENVLTGDMGGGGERKAGRLTVLWEPSSHFDATFLYETQDVSLEGFTTEILASNAGVDALAAGGGVPDLETDFDRRTAYSDSRLPEGYFDRAEINRASLTAHWNFGDGFVLTSQTGWSEGSGQTAGGTDFLPGDYFLYQSSTDTSTLSQEIRLTSPSEDRFRYAVGVWIGRNEASLPDDWNITLPPPPDGPGAAHWQTVFDQTTESWSVFGQADYDITDRLTLSGGIRYNDEDKEVDIGRNVIVPGILTLPGGYEPYAPFTMSRSESATDGLVNLRYEVSDDLMFYVAWAQGTKSGGFAQNTTVLSDGEYDPEVAQTTELGLRYQSRDRSLTANATLFSTEVTDYQMVTFNGVQFVIDNTDLESQGFETQVIWRPDFAPGLTLDWSNVYADASDSITGGRIPNAPEWSGLVSVTYEHRLADGFNLILNGGANYESDQTRQQDPSFPPPSDDITLFDASIGVEADAGYSIRLAGRNLTNENRTVFAFPTPFAPPGSWIGVSERPRTIALELSYKY